jgi:hypothetical protein
MIIRLLIAGLLVFAGCITGRLGLDILRHPITRVSWLERLFGVLFVLLSVALFVLAVVVPTSLVHKDQAEQDCESRPGHVYISREDACVVGERW